MAKRSRALVEDTAAELQIGDRTYLVSQMTLKASFAIQRAAREALPGPVVHRPEADVFLGAIERDLDRLLERYGKQSSEGMNENQQERHLLNLRGKSRELIQAALRDTLESFVDWPGQVGTTEMGVAFLNTEEGQRLLVKHALLPHQPELSDEELERILSLMTMTQFERLVEVFMPPAREEDSGPLPPAGKGDFGGSNGTSTLSIGTASTPLSPGTTAGTSKPSIA